MNVWKQKSNTIGIAAPNFEIMRRMVVWKLDEAAKKAAKPKKYKAA